MTNQPLLNALDALAARAAVVRQEYTLLDAEPASQTVGRREALLDYYAVLEETAEGLRQILGRTPASPPVAASTPPSRLTVLPVPPRPVKVTVTVTREDSWWTRPDADFRAKGEEIRNRRAS